MPEARSFCKEHVASEMAFVWPRRPAAGRRGPSRRARASLAGGPGCIPAGSYFSTRWIEPGASALRRSGLAVVAITQAPRASRGRAVSPSSPSRQAASATAATLQPGFASTHRLIGMERVGMERARTAVRRASARRAAFDIGALRARRRKRTASPGSSPTATLRGSGLSLRPRRPERRPALRSSPCAGGAERPCARSWSRSWTRRA